MQKIFFFLFVILIDVQLFAQNIGELSNDTTSNNYTDIVSDTIPDINIFDNNEPLDITLKYDITSFVKNKDKGKYVDALLKIHYSETDSIIKKIRLKARGNFRRDNCFFPPIHLNFKSDPIENSELTGKIKLVTHCSNVNKYENYILKEYLVYKLYNVLTDYSFRVRLLNITYIDTGKKKKDYKRVGFLIEPFEVLTKRNNAYSSGSVGIGKSNIEQNNADKVSVFEYMIGNTDWKFKGGHNMKYIKPLDTIVYNAIAIPYDFDFSGFVGTSYSFPQSWTSIENVYDREYTGYCRDTDEEYLRILEFFLDKRDELFNVIESFEYISDKQKKSLIKYLDNFLSDLDKPERIMRNLKKECRSDF